MKKDNIYSFTGDESPKELANVLNTTTDIDEQVKIFSQIINLLVEKTSYRDESMLNTKVYLNSRLAYIKFFVHHSIEDVKKIKYLIPKIIEKELSLIKAIERGETPNIALDKKLVSGDTSLTSHSDFAAIGGNKLPNILDLGITASRFLLLANKEDFMLDLKDYEIFNSFPPAIVQDEINKEIARGRDEVIEFYKRPFFSKNGKLFADIDWIDFLNHLTQDKNLYNELRSRNKKEIRWYDSDVFSGFMVWIIVGIVIALLIFLVF